MIIKDCRKAKTNMTLNHLISGELFTVHYSSEKIFMYIQEVWSDSECEHSANAILLENGQFYYFDKDTTIIPVRGELHIYNK